MNNTANNPYQQVQDASHIRSLAICHSIYGGLCILGGVGLIILSIVMINIFSGIWSTVGGTSTFATSTFATTGAGLPTSPGAVSVSAPASGSTFATSATFGTTGGSPAEMFDTMESVMNVYFALYAGAGVLALILGILCVVSARMMSQRRGQTFSLVVAGINCLNFPLGTTLGVFTFVVLLRASVAAEYRQAADGGQGSIGPSNT